MSKQRRGKRAANISYFFTLFLLYIAYACHKGTALCLHLFTYAGDATVKNLPANSGDTGDAGSIPGSGIFPWSIKWQPSQVFLPEKIPCTRSLAAYSPWSHKESDMTD